MVGLVLIVAGVTLLSGWVQIIPIVLGALVALSAAGSLAFTAWGQRIGYSFHFTP